MTQNISRRTFAKLAGLGGVAFASGLFPRVPALAADDFFFVQMSDLHWGFQGPAVNPEAATTLPRAVAAVNALPTTPDFILFTGDLTHTTDDGQERRRRLAKVKELTAGLAVKDLRFIPGEHDAALDNGQAFHETFGPSSWGFVHKGVHFLAIDNVSDPGAKVGDQQIAWLKDQLAPLPKDSPIVVATHRPLFDLYPDWDWATRDGAAVVEALMPYANVVVLYGHIHQEHHHATGHINHHAARSLIFPLPAPGSTPKRGPVKWDPAAPFRGLGFREVGTQPPAAWRLEEFAVTGGKA